MKDFTLIKKADGQISISKFEDGVDFTLCDLGADETLSMTFKEFDEFVDNVNNARRIIFNNGSDDFTQNVFNAGDKVHIVSVRGGLLNYGIDIIGEVIGRNKHTPFLYDVLSLGRIKRPYYPLDLKKVSQDTPLTTEEEFINASKK